MGSLTLSTAIWDYGRRIVAYEKVTLSVRRYSSIRVASDRHLGQIEEVAVCTTPEAAEAARRLLSGEIE